MISTYCWGTKYGASDVLKLAAGIKKHLRQPYKFVLFCFSVMDDLGKVAAVAEVNPIQDKALCEVPGCFARLRMFDPAWQEAYEITDRLVCIDLDTVITSHLDPLFDRPEPFVILRGANSGNPNPLNGSLMMLRAGAHPEVWSDFSLEKARKVPFHEFPDDQGWIWHKVQNAAGWQCGPESGVWAFAKGAWPKSNKLPEGARIVTFPGWRSPQQFRHLPFVKEHWRA